MSDAFSSEELQLAARNHGMPIEALRYDVTPAGLHYLLIHYDIPAVDVDAWRLHVGGVIAHPLELSLEDLRARASVTSAVTLECAGNGRAFLQPRPISQPWILGAVGNAEWTGVPLRDLLEDAGIERGAVEVLFTALDRGVEGDVEQSYERSLPLDEAMREDLLLAFEMNGQPLLPQHGFPLRLVVPGWYGMTHVKWLSRITVLTEPFEGFQQARGYRFRSDPDEVGEPVSRIRPRSLMVPPGIPEFLTRSRIVDAGTQVVRGRAWSGLGAIDRVEFSDDDARMGLRVARLGRRAGALLPGHGRIGRHATAASGMERRRLREQRRPARAVFGPRLSERSERSTSSRRRPGRVGGHC
jgi:sulfane dehydrogenase subunit SoxC